ncbi:hypothetical protein PSA7680_01678 [Pseudoruegeria aquimaris]|uniref:Uncharacterized protein n=1 Tax=Pseudoruegeria aquimaris TaxID=393663 RepID=A0A1Y5S9S5_9RHOB|nr:DUF6478 family protein [Pseudoruegeria aquimaris]SLN35672.1 hypothetical protein PSA7680_01678 [Pseudoruegeria aquimaris]
MAKRIDTQLDGFLFKRNLARWKRLAAAAEAASPSDLRKWRGRARQLRSQLDKLTYVADSRLTLPMIGSNAIQKPMFCDWAYRPELWRGPLNPPGRAAVQTQEKIGSEVTVYHDCSISELTVRQIRNTREEDLAPFGLRMDVFRFDGSFLSLAIDLPEEAAHGLRKRHLVKLDAIVELEKPLEIFARLNVKHGPNTEQIVRELPWQSEDVSVEFDMTYTKLNEKRVERMWVDFIFEGPEMNQIILRDLTLTRRPRAEL